MREIDTKVARLQIRQTRTSRSLALSAGILFCAISACTVTDPYSEAYFSVLNDTDAGVYVVIIPEAGDTIDMSTLEAALLPDEAVAVGSAKGIGYSPPQWNIEIYETVDDDALIAAAAVPDLSDAEIGRAHV